MHEAFQEFQKRYDSLLQPQYKPESSTSVEQVDSAGTGSGHNVGRLMDRRSSSMSVTDTENIESPKLSKKRLSKESPQDSPSKRNLDDMQRRMFKL